MTDAPPPYPGINGYTGYQQSVGAGGFTNPSGASANMSSAEAKAAEAAGKITIYEHFFLSFNSIYFLNNFLAVETAYVDQASQPQTVYLPGDMPPSYDESVKKNN